MKKVFDNIKLYLSFFVASLKELLIYRIDCLTGIISRIVTQAVEVIFIWITFQNTDNLAGWNFRTNILLFYGTTLISNGILDLCFDALYDIETKIYSRWRI